MRRLTLQFTALILLIVVCVGAVVFAIVSQSASEANTKALLDATHVDSARDAPLGTWIAVWRNGSVETSRDQIAGLPDLTALAEAQASTTHEAVRTTITSDGRTFDVLTIATRDGEVQVARDQHETREELERLAWALVIAGSVAAGFSAIGSAWMARRAIQPLADSLELQRRFVADASHELRTPLTLLSTRAQLARRRLTASTTFAQGASEADAHTVDDLNLIVNDARKLTDILEDLLIAADTRSVAPQTIVDVAAVAQAASAASNPRAAEQGVEIHTEVVQSGATILASPPAIERLFLALLDNAIDHARSRIIVTVAVQGKSVTATVSDDGQGFTESARTQAFERFASNRQELPAPDAPRHYGIGLALVAEIAGRAGGTVRVDGHSGSGGAIVVTLPRAP